MSHMLPNIRIKRVYDPPAPDDGVRVLVDRLWPRGLRRTDAAIDRWFKDIAPSTELRRWFGHDPRAAGTSSSAATVMSCPPGRRCWTNCATWRAPGP
jgi:hypothetical protein